MSPITKTAAVQINPELMQNEKNLGKILGKMREAASNGAQLIVFPECALTGYMFMSREEAFPFAETIPGPATEKVGALCKQLNVHVIFGMIEKDVSKLYNAAAFAGPDGLIGKYRKNHIPLVGLDRFMEKGDNRLEVFRTPIGNIGILICYDMTFPENARVLMLKGADIIAVVTNWPKQRDVIPRYVINTRAMENHVYVIAADRVGVERGAKFCGMSKIAGPAGQTAASASMIKEEIIYADIDLSLARQKHVTYIPGVMETDFIIDRRPELYGEITRDLRD